MEITSMGHDTNKVQSNKITLLQTTVAVPLEQSKQQQRTAATDPAKNINRNKEAFLVWEALVTKRDDHLPDRPSLEQCSGHCEAERWQDQYRYRQQIKL